MTITLDCNHRIYVILVGAYRVSVGLSVCVFVMSWSENVRLLDGHVHVVLFLVKDRVSRICDVHHCQMLLVGSTYGTRSDNEPMPVHTSYVHCMQRF